MSVSETRPIRSPSLARAEFRDGIDERLILSRMIAARCHGGLSAGLGGEAGRAHIRYPDLYRSQSLTTHPRAVGGASTNSGLFLLSHVGHVTCDTTYQPIRSQNNAATKLRYSSSATRPCR